MSLPDLNCDPYQTLLQAGSLRAQAAKLERQAGMYEQIVREQLAADGHDCDSQFAVPGKALCVAVYGPADGAVSRLPIEQITAATLLFAPVRPGHAFEVGADDSLVRAITDAGAATYEPALVARNGPTMGVVLVPKGKLPDFYADMAIRGERSRKPSYAIAKMLVLLAGLNSEMVHAMVTQVQRGADDADASTSAPIFIQL